MHVTTGMQDQHQAVVGGRLLSILCNDDLRKT